MSVARTVDEKHETLKLRLKEQRGLEKQVDAVLSRNAELEAGEELGCGGRGCVPWLGRVAARSLGLSARTRVATRELSESGAAPRAAASGASRIFGVRSSAADPARKLELAGEALGARVASLEARAQQHRAAAKAAMADGSRPQALRELKRAKALDKQHQASQSVLDSIEMQSDLLAQTAVQKEVAAALGATTKSLKKEKHLLAKAEDAVDGAVELRDIHDDLTSVMLGLGDSAGDDDDQLLAELEEMASTGAVGQPEQRGESGAEVDSYEDALRALRMLENKHAKEDALTKLRKALPSAPKQEKQKLLAKSVERSG